MAFLRKVIVVSMMIFFVGVSIQNGYAVVTSTCSTTKRLNTPQTTYRDMYKYDEFRDLYHKKISSIINWDTPVFGNPLWHNNFNSNCNNGEFVGNEKSKRTVRWNKYGQELGIKNVDSNLSISDTQKMQQYITKKCGLTLNNDGGVGIKTINSIQLCELPVGGKLGRTEFQSLTEAKVLFTDVKGNDLIYDSSKKVFSQNFKPDDIYVDTSKAPGIKDEATATAKGLKIVTKITDTSDICKSTLLKDVEQSVYTTMLPNLNTSNKCCYKGPKPTLPPSLPTTIPNGWNVTETTATFTPTTIGPQLPIPQVPVCTTEDIKNSTSSSSTCRFAEPKAGTPEYNTYQNAIAGGLVQGDCATKKCPIGDYKEVMKGGSMLCEKCDIEKCNCGIKLNTYVPFIGRCIMNKQDNNSGQNGDTTTVNSLNAFPILMGALIKLLMSIIMILCFASLIVGGFMMTIPDQYDTGKGLVKKVIWTIVALGSLGTILYLINPNFFT